MRSRLIGLAVLAVVAGCTDSTPTSTLTKAPGSLRKVVVTGTLDQNIATLIALWPQGLSTASGTRWQNIKDSYTAGQISVAKSKLVELTKFIIAKTNDMSTPPNGETKKAAAARLVLYMSLYIYNGPTTTPPDFSPDADNAIGVLTASAPLTVVTPTQHAGAQFDAGSTSEDRIIVITQNPTPYPAECSGPLQTTLCQYPLFYYISSFPDTKLLKMAKASICHINNGTSRLPLADHDRFRLAHAKPANPSDYTPGSTVRDNIEILPLISQNFVFCDDVEEPPVIASTTIGRGLQLASSLASKVIRKLTPASAYAIDQGGGGGFEVFSPFNDVDPLSQPDLDVQGFSAPAGPFTGVTATSMTFSVKNIGTGTNDPTSATIRISTDTTITNADALLATVSVPSIPPGSSYTATAVPFSVPVLATGTYYIGVVIDDVASTPDLALANNFESRSVTVNEPAGPAATTIDFETPSLGANDRAVSNPYTVGYVTFTSIDPSFSDDVVGLVKNSATSACSPPSSANQTLGTGRYPYAADGGIGLSGFDIRADFGTPINSAQSVVVDVQALGGETATMTLYNSANQVVGTASGTVPSTGVCIGYPGGNRGTLTLTASGLQASYAIISVPTSVFVIDNFKVQDPPVILF
jgi:hypothetical protein